VDGFKGRLKDSLQAQISIWLIGAILIVAIVAGIFSFAAAFNEAHELQDDVLRQIAGLYDRQHLPNTQYSDSSRVADNDEESRVYVQLLSAATTGNPNPGGLLKIPPDLHPGVYTIEIGGIPYRIFVRLLNSGESIAVAQEARLQDEIARDSALRTSMPFLILIPVLLILVAFVVRRMIAPIARLSDEIDQRSDHELHSLDPGKLPKELRPFLFAINRLLRRVSGLMEVEKRFVADAAHELRSPFTALSLQVERLASAEMSDTARERLVILRQGIDRERVLLEQLLALSKANSTSVGGTTKVSLHEAIKRALEDLMMLATSKNIDIGAVDDTDAMILGNELDLSILIKNLIDNAIRYTPNDGRIDLTIKIEGQAAILKISDTGPGIPVEERERVFDPFYRVLGNDEIGSGLGMSIVKAIATKLGASVSLDYANQEMQSGLDVKVVFQKAS
jgi:two-component system OmpR family sensor kinase